MGTNWEPVASPSAHPPANDSQLTAHCLSNASACHHEEKQKHTHAPGMGSLPQNGEEWEQSTWDLLCDVVSHVDQKPTQQEQHTHASGMRARLQNGEADGDDPHGSCSVRTIGWPP